jgi:hypothetical protein
MSIKSDIPQSSKLCIIGGIFTGVLNNPTIGKYNFTDYKIGGNRVNVAVPLGLAMNPNYLYFFHEINFSMSIAESSFLEAIEPGTVPQLAIKDSTSRRSIFHLPFRLFRYFENAAMDSFHFNSNGNASLLGDFQGMFSLVASLVGVSSILAQISMSVYEITEEKFIKNYKRETGI